MAKTPSKRGSGRGKTGTGSGKPATKPDDTRKDTGRKAAGTKAGGKTLPGWMPDAPPAGKPSRHDKPAAGKAGAGSTGGVPDPPAPRAEPQHVVEGQSVDRSVKSRGHR